MRIAVLAMMAVTCFAASDEPAGWNGKAAAAYLDQRAEWWSGWKTSARDHGTFCVSCHTALPYALGRPALRSTLGESGPSAAEQTLVANVTKRVRQWNEMEPFYPDATRGVPKTAESRGTEAVLNAVILTTYDVHSRKLGDDAKIALENMWSLQLTSGDKKGAWTWLNFHNAPWEGEDSQYWGATLGAIAAGSAPADYRARPEIQEHINLLSVYLRQEANAQPMLNRVFLLYAAAKIPQLLSPDLKKKIVAEIEKQQQTDGGWTLSTMIGDWKRKDNTALESKSDGYATGLVAYTLELSGVPRDNAALKRGLTLAGSQSGQVRRSVDRLLSE